MGATRLHWSTEARPQSTTFPERTFSNARRSCHGKRAPDQGARLGGRAFAHGNDPQNPQVHPYDATPATTTTDKHGGEQRKSILLDLIMELNKGVCLFAILLPKFGPACDVCLWQRSFTLSISFVFFCLPEDGKVV